MARLGGVTGEIWALLVTVGVHIVGAWALIAVLLRDADVSWRDWWPRDDDGRGPSGPEPDPAPSPTGGDVPLADAAPARVRLREPGRLGEAYPRPARRPAHPPAPERAPERVAERP
jgi:hypothetical protein